MITLLFASIAAHHPTFPLLRMNFIVSNILRAAPGILRAALLFKSTDMLAHRVAYISPCVIKEPRFLILRLRLAFTFQKVSYLVVSDNLCRRRASPLVRHFPAQDSCVCRLALKLAAVTLLDQRGDLYRDICQQPGKLLAGVHQIIHPGEVALQRLVPGCYFFDICD